MATAELCPHLQETHAVNGRPAAHLREEIKVELDLDMALVSSTVSSDSQSSAGHQAAQSISHGAVLGVAG